MLVLVLLLLLMLLQLPSVYFIVADTDDVVGDGVRVRVVVVTAPSGVAVIITVVVGLFHS